MRSILSRTAWLWPALGILAACGSSSSSGTGGISAYISGVQSGDGSLNGVLNSGSPPSGSGPSVSVSSLGASIAGGAQFVPVTCSTNCTTVVVAVQGVDGFYELSGLTAGTSQTIIVNIAQSATERAAAAKAESVATSGNQDAAPSFTLEIGAGLAGAFGALVAVPITLTSVGSGDVEVSLNWDVDTDADLHVVDPTGFEIYYGATTSPSGGSLDLDSNAACSLDHKRAEHVTWPTTTPPSGTYEVIVDSWSMCTLPSVNYLVTVNVKGKAPQTYPGNFTTADNGGTCWVGTGQPVACGTLVTSFTYP